MDIEVQGTGSLEIGSVGIVPIGFPVEPHFAELMPTCGLPIRGGVSEDYDAAQELADSQDHRERAKAKGHRQNLNRVWDYLPTFGFQNPFRQSRPPQQTTYPAPDQSEIRWEGSVDAINRIQNQQTAARLLRTTLPPDDTTNLMVAEAMRSSAGPESFNPFHKERLEALDQDHYTYTGSDLRVIVEVAGSRGTAGKQLVELSTITTSIHREKSPIRACGYINPKAFAYGRRTIAGTIILTQFWMDSLLRFLAGSVEREFYSGYKGDVWEDEFIRSQELSAKDRSYSKVDQLPPMNMTFFFADEYGHASVRRLLGVTLVTDGSVYSINDQITEQTISYMALDFTPLQPIDTLGVLKDNPRASEKTPRTVVAETWLTKPFADTRPPNVPLRIPQPVFSTQARPRPTSAGEWQLPEGIRNIFRRVLG